MAVAQSEAFVVNALCIPATILPVEEDATLFGPHRALHVDRDGTDRSSTRWRDRGGA